MFVNPVLTDEDVGHRDWTTVAFPETTPLFQTFPDVDLTTPPTKLLDRPGESVHRSRLLRGEYRTGVIVIDRLDDGLPIAVRTRSSDGLEMGTASTTGGKRWVHGTVRHTCAFSCFGKNVSRRSCKNLDIFRSSRAPYPIGVKSPGRSITPTGTGSHRRNGLRAVLSGGFLQDYCIIAFAVGRCVWGRQTVVFDPHVWRRIPL